MPAPAFLDQSGPIIIGVAIWPTGLNNGSGCGDLTGMTPLAPYRDTARSCGAET